VKLYSFHPEILYFRMLKLWVSFRKRGKEPFPDENHITILNALYQQAWLLFDLLLKPFLKKTRKCWGKFKLLRLLFGYWLSGSPDNR